jgi:hypothetical protein
MSKSRNDRRPKKPARTAAARKQSLAPAQDDFSRVEVRRRFICNGFKFWRNCAERPCQRAHACVGDAVACFKRRWWLVHEADKIHFRAGIKARLAGLSVAEACRAADEEVARSADHIAEVNARTLARLEAMEAEARKRDSG